MSKKEPLSQVIHPDYDPNRAKVENAWWSGFQPGVATGILIGAIVVSAIMVGALSRDIFVRPPQGDASRCVLECPGEVEP